MVLYITLPQKATVNGKAGLIKSVFYAYPPTRRFCLEKVKLVKSLIVRKNEPR